MKKIKSILSAVTALSLTVALAGTASAAGASNASPAASAAQTPKTAAVQTAASTQGTQTAAKDLQQKANTEIDGIISAVREAVAKLSKEDKATLSEQLRAFEQAAGGQSATEVKTADRQASGAAVSDKSDVTDRDVLEAVRALLNAAKENDIDIELPQEIIEQIFVQEMDLGIVDAEAVETAVQALSDKDKRTLSDAIEAFEDALAAERQAVSRAKGGDDLSSYHQAVIDAIQALFEAADEAGITLALPLPTESYSVLEEKHPEVKPAETQTAETQPANTQATNTQPTNTQAPAVQPSSQPAA